MYCFEKEGKYLMRDTKLFISVVVFLMSLIVDKIPYVNIFFGERIWILYLAEIAFFILLFFPYHKISIKETVLLLSLLSILFLIVSMIFSFFEIIIVPEVLGVIIYFSFWFIVIRQISVFIKSEKN